jgi:phosphatidate cytidylyltransferase
MTWKRVVTAAVLIPVVVGLVLFTPTSVVALAVAVITVLALREYFHLGEAIGHRAYRWWTIFCSLLLVVSQNLYLMAHPIGRIRVYLMAPGSQLRHDPASSTDAICSVPMQILLRLDVVTVLFVFILGIAVLTLFTRRPLVEALPGAGISSSSLLLVAFPLSFSIRLHGFYPQGPLLLLFALVITWAADTSAYFVGRAIGKHPLAPHLSPKKTWEGSVGSMIGSLAVAYGFSFWLRIPLPHLLAMAALGNVAGQMGDLLESAYKRSAGVKDSGSLLPGHGGMLDRIDALILCFPVIWYYLVLVNLRLQ